MAFSERDLTTEWMPQVRFPNGANVNLRTVQAAIREQCEENGIPVAFREEQLKTGSLLNRQVEEVLIMYNPEHATDYLRFLLRVQHMGKYAFLHVFNMGGSKNFKNSNMAANGSTLAILGNLFSGTNTKLQIEENYYTILQDCLSNCVG